MNFNQLNIEISWKICNRPRWSCGGCNFPQQNPPHNKPRMGCKQQYTHFFFWCNVWVRVQKVSHSCSLRRAKQRESERKTTSQCNNDNITGKMKGFSSKKKNKKTTRFHSQLHNHFVNARKRAFRSYAHIFHISFCNWDGIFDLNSITDSSII